MILPRATTTVLILICYGYLNLFLYVNLIRWFYGRPCWFIGEWFCLRKIFFIEMFCFDIASCDHYGWILNLLWVFEFVLYVNLSRWYYGRPCWFIKSIQVLSRYSLMNYFSLMLLRATTTVLILDLLWVFESVLYENLSRCFYGRPCCNKKSRF